MRSWYPPKRPRKPLRGGGGGALAELRRRHERRLSARQPCELLASPEERRSLEAGRFGVLALRVALLAAVRLAVEALDHAERSRAVVGIRRRVGVRALPGRTVRPAPEAAAVDD